MLSLCSDSRDSRLSHLNLKSDQIKISRSIPDPPYSCPLKATSRKPASNNLVMVTIANWGSDALRGNMAAEAATTAGDHVPSDALRLSTLRL